MERRYYIIQIQDSYLAELIFWWLQYDKPCNLLFQKPKSEGLNGVRAVVDTIDASDFLEKAKETIRFKLFEEDENHNLLDNQRPR